MFVLTVQSGRIIINRMCLSIDVLLSTKYKPNACYIRKRYKGVLQIQYNTVYDDHIILFQSDQREISINYNALFSPVFPMTERIDCTYRSIEHLREKGYVQLLKMIPFV